MGCDIHIFAEVKEGATWKKVGSVFKGYNDALTDEPYEGRHYDLFSVLADVRNRNNLKPIKEPTYQLPEGVSDEIKQYYEDVWEGDAHSLTSYTLKELLDFDWNFQYVQSGMISPEQIKDLEKGILPDNWCQGTNMPGFERREWLQTFESSFATETIPDLQKLGDPENVRVILWFDN